MPGAVTHVLIVIVLLSLFRDFFVKDKKKFPLHYILLGGIAGLLPDIDVIIYWILSYSGYTFEQIHRTFTHTLILPLFFLLLIPLTAKIKSRQLGKHHLKLSRILAIICFGVFVHLLLDYLISGTIAPLFPFIKTGFGLNLISLLPSQFQSTFLPALDAIILVAWLIYVELKHKISDFI